MNALAKPFGKGLVLGAFVGLGIVSLLFGYADFFIASSFSVILAYALLKQRIFAADRAEQPTLYWFGIALCGLLIALNLFRILDRSLEFSM
ncbi:MAG: hypothetical protein AAGL10_09135 [Pseudomonadota bacterium]